MPLYFFLASSSAAFYKCPNAINVSNSLGKLERAGEGTYGIGPLLSLTSVPLVGSRSSQGDESVELLLLGGDGSRLLGGVRGGDGERLSGGGSLQLLGLAWDGLVMV